jgi:hypothetical protein
VTRVPPQLITVNCIVDVYRALVAIYAPHRHSDGTVDALLHGALAPWSAGYVCVQSGVAAISNTTRDASCAPIMPQVPYFCGATNTVVRAAVPIVLRVMKQEEAAAIGIRSGQIRKRLMPGTMIESHRAQLHSWPPSIIGAFAPPTTWHVVQRTKGHWHSIALASTTALITVATTAVITVAAAGATTAGATTVGGATTSTSWRRAIT